MLPAQPTYPGSRRLHPLSPPRRRCRRQRRGLRVRPALHRVFGATAATRRAAEEGTQIPVRRHHLDCAARHPRQERYAHLTVSAQVLLLSLLPDLSRLTARELAYVRRRASVDFVVYNRVTNQPLLAIEVDGFAFHENRPDQRVRDALKDQILLTHQMPRLRLRTTDSGEERRIRQALDDAEARGSLVTAARPVVRRHRPSSAQPDDHEGFFPREGSWIGIRILRGRSVGIGGAGLDGDEVMVGQRPQCAKGPKGPKGAKGLLGVLGFPRADVGRRLGERCRVGRSNGPFEMTGLILVCLAGSSGAGAVR